MNERERASGRAQRWLMRAGRVALMAALWAAVLALLSDNALAQTGKAKAGASANVASPAAGAASPRSPNEASAKPVSAKVGAGAATTGEAAKAPAGSSTIPASSAATTPGTAVSQPGPVAGSQAQSRADSPSAGAMDATTYVVRLRDLESRVDELKEQIRRSHTRLSLLSDTILSGGIGGAEADIVFKNEMSNAFRVVSVLFVLDGAVMKKEQDDTGELAAKKSIPVYNGPLTPGDHTLQVVVVFQGHGYGVFSYLRAHKYTTKHTHSFTVTEGKVARIEATAFEKGGVTTPIDQRPNVRFTEKIVGSLEAKTGSN